MIKKLFRWMGRRWYVMVGLLGALLLLAAFLFPYLLKRYVETRSEEWIQRKVTINSIVLNPFTGVYAVNGLVCYEPKSDVVFVRFDKLGVKADLLDGYRKGIWHFREAEMRGPYVRIEQNGDRFNFSDLLELGDAEKEPTTKDTSEIAFDVAGIEISAGRIDYSSDILHTPVSVVDLDVSCSRISSAQAVMKFLLGFGIGGGGRVNGGFTIDTDRHSYTVDAHLREFAMAQVLPYLQDIMDCRKLEGVLDMDLVVNDNYVDTTQLALSAAIDLRSLRLEDPAGEALVSIGELRAGLDTLIAARERFDIGDVLLEKADLRFILLNDWSDNWTRLLKLNADTAGDSTEASSAASESNIFVMLADYVSYLGSQFVASDYSARSARVTNCALHFEDYTPRLPFRYEITELSLAANRVSSDQDAGRITSSATLNGSGALKGAAVFDPADLRNVTVDLEVDGLRLPSFDPYTRWYAAHPMEDGVLRYATRTAVLAGKIDSQNELYIDKLKFGRKVTEHDTGIYVLPLRLAAGLLKDAKGVVELDVPVKGDLKDPQFRVWPIIWQIFKNLIVKAATAPANLLARAVGGADASELEGVHFDQAQAVPSAQQYKVLDQLAKALAAKPELRADLIPLVDASAEAQEIALFEGKRRFLFADAPTIAAADSTRIKALANTDSLFVRYVEQATPALTGKPVQERCLGMIGRDNVMTQQREIEYARTEHVMQYLLGKGVPAARVSYREGTPEEINGRTGDPGYRFIYDAADESLNGDALP